ncbi:hypothetical protein HK099_000098 [Clydaea vesicula]|uniref:Uncharacterized protein n=1 Tax=Clydaea vesicula TaxID=447962 RepID=A0AAD5TXM6_9FUNG|nr:hypothetical protein HK099_000098 [Clydaea vesicula]
MRRALHREDKLEKINSMKTTVQRNLSDRILFFKYAIPDDNKVCSSEEILDVVDTYLNRHEEEIETLTKSLRKNRPKPARLIFLETLKTQESKEFTGLGLELPDLTKLDNIIKLKKWDGDYNGISLIKMMVFRDPKIVKLEVEKKNLKIEQEKIKALENLELKKQNVDSNESMKID